MDHYVGIDVSLEASSVCVVDGNFPCRRDPEGDAARNPLVRPHVASATGNGGNGSRLGHGRACPGQSR